MGWGRTCSYLAEGGKGWSESQDRNHNAVMTTVSQIT